jgi:hypothetical protein
VKWGALVILALVSGAEAQSVPSGQTVTLQEVLVDRLGEETWLRFRFIAPQISNDGNGIDYESAAEDMIALCQSLALPYMDEFELEGDVIVVSFSDRAVEFGQADPEATQFFEAFRHLDGNCIWETL